MEEKNKILSDLDFLEDIFKGILNKNENSRQNQNSLLFGVILGIVTNFLVLLMWELGVKEFPLLLQFSILSFFLIILTFIFFGISMDEIKFKNLNNELEEKISQIRMDKNLVKRGEADYITEEYLINKYSI